MIGCVGGFGTGAIGQVGITPDPAWEGAFVQTSGWTGGDGQSSANLSDGRTVWVFSDTVVGDVIAGQRTNSTYVHNSVAIHDTPAVPGAAPSAAEMEFVIGDDGLGNPDAWIVPDVGVLDETGGPGLWWPVSVMEIPGPSGSRVIAGGVHKGLRLSQSGLIQMGDLLVVIEPWSGPLSGWSANASQYDITHSVDGPEAAADPNAFVTKWGRAFYYDGDSTAEAAGGWVYVYAVQNYAGGVRRFFVARAPAHDIEDMSSWRFYDGSGGWAVDASVAAPIATGVTNFLSVDRLPNGVYVMIHSELPTSTNTIMLRTAPAPEGPWSGPQSVYTIPDDIPGADPLDYHWYGAVGHGDLSAPEELLISYISNTSTHLGVINNPGVYVPRFVRLDLQTIPATANGSVSVPALSDPQWLIVVLVLTGMLLASRTRRASTG